jgi:DNA helicase-2/ATP-dependent DNA helicase PcrA
VCRSTLTSAVERKVGRCSSCPATYDEVVFQRLREWRSKAAEEAKCPAFVIFTDATLVAIAERMPADESELGRIAGVGQVKKERFADAVLDVLNPT